MLAQNGGSISPWRTTCGFEAHYAADCTAILLFRAAATANFFSGGGFRNSDRSLCASLLAVDLCASLLAVDFGSLAGLALDAGSPRAWIWLYACARLLNATRGVKHVRGVFFVG